MKATLVETQNLKRRYQDCSLQELFAYRKSLQRMAQTLTGSLKTDKLQTILIIETLIKEKS